MEPVDTHTPDKRTSGLWFLVPCSLLAIASGLVLCAGLLAQHKPTWMAVGAGLATFPLLPLLWHLLGETGGKDRAPDSLSGRSRLGLRALAVAVVVLGVSLGNLGTKQVIDNLRGLTGLLRKQPTQDAQPVPVATTGARHGLESFIPADATMVVGLAGSTAVEQLLAAHGITARAELSALATCQIDFADARILIATRAGGAQMIVVRASGIADERNLYCLVGVLGADHLQIRSEGAGNTRTLQVNGFLSRTLSFRIFDGSTVIATDEAWRDSEGKKLFAADGITAQGRLGPPILRLDRGAPLWMASAAQTPQGDWDLAIDCRQEGAMLNLRGSATPPSGETDRAELSVRVPLAFVRTLPERAVSLGIRGVVAAALAANGEPSPAQAAAAAPPATPPQDAGAR
jgi:hypothetical protein